MIDPDAWKGQILNVREQLEVAYRIKHFDTNTLAAGYSRPDRSDGPVLYQGINPRGSGCCDAKLAQKSTQPDDIDRVMAQRVGTCLQVLAMMGPLPAQLVDLIRTLDTTIEDAAREGGS